MKVKVYGFEWKLGSGIPIEDFCSHLSLLPGPPETNRIMAFSDLGDYLGGTLITIKNMKAYCQMKVDGGKFTVSPQKLEENASIADFNYFIIHKQTHKGLYQYYHQSSGTTSFCNYCKTHYNKLRSIKINDEINRAGGNEVITKSDRKEIIAKYKGTFGFGVLLKPENFKQYVRQMKKIKDFSIEFSSISEQEKTFLPASEFSKRISHRFVFSEDTIVDTIRDKIMETLDLCDTKKANVNGLNESGEAVSCKLFKDYAVFDEFEYDDIIDDIIISSENLEKSLIDSGVLQLLAKVSNQSTVKRLLTSVSI